MSPRVEWFICAVYTSGLALAFLGAGANDKAVERAARAARSTAPATRISVDLAQCPVHEAGTTPLVSFLIRSTADDKPEVIECLRFAERPHVSKARPK